MYIARHIEKTIKRISSMYPAVIVTGPRQVGKTTVIKKLCGNMKYLSFDDPEILEYAKSEGKLFFRTYMPPVILDEVQYAPEIFPYIKMAADASGGRGMFFMTGSQAFHLMKNVSESLAGRIGIIQMLGLSLREIIGRSDDDLFLPTSEYLDMLEKKMHDGKVAAVSNEQTLSSNKQSISDDKHPTDYGIGITGSNNFLPSEIWKIIKKGSMPRLYYPDINDESWRQYYSDYIRTYIERDVRLLTKVGDEMAFLQFMRLLAASTGQLLNYSRISNDIGKSVETIKNWVSILRTSGIIFLLKPYYSNINKRIIKTPKIYFLDTGLVCYLTGWYTAEQLQFGAMSGSIFETFAVSEIIKNYYNRGYDDLGFSYYRDKDMNEIDLIIEHNGIMHPIEIKKTGRPNKQDIRAFDKIREGSGFSEAGESGLKTGEGGIICMAEESVYLTQSDRVIPLWYI